MLSEILIATIATSETNGELHAENVTFFVVVVCFQCVSVYVIDIWKIMFIAFTSLFILRLCFFFHCFIVKWIRHNNRTGGYSRRAISNLFRNGWNKYIQIRCIDPYNIFIIIARMACARCDFYISFCICVYMSNSVQSWWNVCSHQRPNTTHFIRIQCGQPKPKIPYVNNFCDGMQCVFSLWSICTKSKWINI